jgi:hypothetical protein
MESEIDRFLVLCVSKSDMVGEPERVGPWAVNNGAMLDARRESDKETCEIVEDEGLGEVWRSAGMVGTPGFPDLKFDGRDANDCYDKGEYVLAHCQHPDHSYMPWSWGEL